jgi:hypothetical protein
VTRLVTLAERPDLAEAVPGLLATRWPAYLLAGRAGHGVDLPALLMAVPGLQVVLVADGGEVLAAGLSVPIGWDGTAAGLPAGWDGAVAGAAALADRGGAANACCALSITIGPAATGRGLAGAMVRALKAAAGSAGARALLAPVRPVFKARYPLTPMADYLAWRAADGRPFDPWLRLHLRLGAAVLGIADPAMTVTGTPAQWEEWTGLRLPDTGAYVIPGGLLPLHVDRAADLAVYREPNVWVSHPLSPAP